MFINPRWRAGKLILAGLALLVLGIGACNIPTEYEAEVGKSFAIHIPRDTGEVPSTTELLAFIEKVVRADDISDSISEQVSGEMDINLLLWGSRISRDELTNRLRAEYPAFKTALFEVSELAGSVRGSLADKIGHEVFNIEVSGDDLEEIRQQVLAQLAEQGFTGDATVELYEENGNTRIDITIEEEQ